jgi:hypothetical protein
MLVQPGQALEHSEFVHGEQQFSNTLYGLFIVQTYIEFDHGNKM